MFFRIIIVLTVLAFINIYVALRILGRWPWAEQHAVMVWVFFGLFFLLQLLAPFGERLVFPELSKTYNAPALFSAIGWLSDGALGLVSCLFIYILMADIVGMLWRILTLPADTVDFDRRALITLGAVTLGTVVTGVGQAIAGPKVREVSIPLKNLPASFHGFKIVQISDLHVGSTIGREYTENVTRIANSLKPDLIALTGDFVDGAVDDLAHDIAPLADLEAPHGTFFITGNHEYYWGATAWIKEFTKLGARVLNNEHQIITRDGADIIVAGVTDYSTRDMGTPHAFSPKQSLQGAPEGLTKILLAHQPASYKHAHEAGFHLQLSGHTHAGQYFPFNMMIGLFQRYYKGLNRHEDMWVYVNQGTGYWGPPMRTGVPSEITLITLLREV